MYEDRLKAQKAAFEAFVTITDPVESEKLSLYKSLLPEMEEVHIKSKDFFTSFDPLEPANPCRDEVDTRSRESYQGGGSGLLFWRGKEVSVKEMSSWIKEQHAYEHLHK